MPLIPPLRRQRQADLCEFKASLVCRESFRTARAVTQRKPCLEKSKPKPEKKKKLVMEILSLTQKARSVGFFSFLALHGSFLS